MQTLTTLPHFLSQVQTAASAENNFSARTKEIGLMVFMWLLQKQTNGGILLKL